MTNAMADTTEDLAQPLGSTKSTQRRATKTDQLQKLLARSKGATVKQIGAQLLWQPHTTRVSVVRVFGSKSSLNR